MRRTLTRDAELGGQSLKAGEKIVLWYLSGNRDEGVFADAEHYDVARANARRHLGFGHGIHRCVGARVAELQLTTLLEEMAKRRLRANVIEEPERVATCFVHGYKKVMVKLSHY